MSLIARDAEKSTGRVRERMRLSSATAFFCIALALAAFFVAAGAPTPLLVLYQDEWGFAPWILTLAFGVYALGLLTALLLVGSLSDHVGRRPVLAGALGLELVAMLMFLFAPGIGWIVAARVVQGLATGAATSAFTAAIVELAPTRHKRLGALLGSMSPAGGLGLGALFAGLIAQVSTHAAVIVWTSLAGMMLAGVAVAFGTPETITAQPGAIASLRPHVSVPRPARRQFFAAVPALLGSWMMAALFMGLVPTILGHVFGIHSLFADGATAFIEPGTAAIAALWSGRLKPHGALILGGTTVVAGATLVVLGVAAAALPLLWVGGAIGGIGFGSTLSGTLRALLPLTQQHQRAGMVAAVYLVAYLAFGVPAIVAGQLVAPLGVLTVAVGFGAVTIAASAVGLGGQLRLGLQGAH